MDDQLIMKKELAQVIIDTTVQESGKQSGNHFGAVDAG